MTFADTSYWVALSVSSAGLHSKAAAWSKLLRGGCVTTEYVLIEFVNRLSQPALRNRAHRLLAHIANQQVVRVLSASDALFAAGVKLHSQRADKAWSLTDCISFVVMRDAGITDALTYDQHFEQAGYRALLRLNPPPT